MHKIESSHTDPKITEKTRVGMDLSVVIPVFYGRDFLDTLVTQIEQNIPVKGLKFEIVLVDDGNPDSSWEKIESLATKKTYVKGVKLSRNFGQHYAITAGLTMSSGNRVIVMDCDLQDDPKYFSALWEKAEEGFDVVLTVKKFRAHPTIKNFFAKIFQQVFRFLSTDSRIQMQPNIGAYSLLSRKVVEMLLKMTDQHRHYLLLLQWLGFSPAYVPIVHLQRPSGKSTYSFHKLIAHALNGIVSQSNRLLYLSICLGVLFSSLAILSSMVIVVQYFLHGFQVGWPSLIVTLLLCTGTILIVLGINGLYLGKIFDQTKQRPLFVIEKTLNLDFSLPVFQRKITHQQTQENSSVDALLAVQAKVNTFS